MSLIKVAWCMFRVKNIHSESPSEPLSPWSKAELSNIHYIIRQGKAKLRTIKITSVFHHLPIVGPKQLCVLAHPRSGYFLVIIIFIYVCYNKLMLLSIYQFGFWCGVIRVFIMDRVRIFNNLFDNWHVPSIILETGNKDMVVLYFSHLISKY